MFIRVGVTMATWCGVRQTENPRGAGGGSLDAARGLPAEESARVNRATAGESNGATNRVDSCGVWVFGRRSNGAEGPRVSADETHSHSQRDASLSCSPSLTSASEAATPRMRAQRSRSRDEGRMGVGTMRSDRENSERRQATNKQLQREPPHPCGCALYFVSSLWQYDCSLGSLDAAATRCALSMPCCC